MLYMKVAKSKFWVPIIRNFFYFLILHLNQMIDISKSYCDNHFIIYMSKHCAVHLIQLYASYISIKLEGEKMSFTYIHFCCSVAVSNTLQPHGLQHTRLLCPSPSPSVCPSSHPSSRWYHLTISSSVVPFSSCPQSFPASGSFLMSQLFASCGQSIGASASTISPSNEYVGMISFRIHWFDLLAVQRILKSLFYHHNLKPSVLWHSAFFIAQLSHLY